MKLQPLILIAGILWYELYTHAWAKMVLRLSVGYASHACNHRVVRSGPFIGEDGSNDERLPPLVSSTTPVLPYCITFPPRQFRASNLKG